MDTPATVISLDSTPTIIEIGKQRRKKVKALLRGKGKLLEEITAAVDALKADGTVPASAHAIIVVVEKKSKQKLPRLFR